MDDELDWEQLLEEFLDYVADTTGAEDPANAIATLRNVVGRWIRYALEQGARPHARNESLLDEWVMNVLSIGTGPQRDYRARVRRWWKWNEDGSATTDVPDCWVVRAGREGEAVKHNLANDVVTIGWGGASEFERVAHCGSREEFRDLIDERLPDRPESERRSACEQIWRFAREIEVGDLVVMPVKGMGPDGNSFAIGRVEGPYEFDSRRQPDYLVQRRSVTWLRKEIERKTVREDLRNSLDTPMTVFGLRRRDAARRIHHLAEHGVDPGDRRTQATADDDGPEARADSARQRLAVAQEKAVERLETAAKHLLCREEFLRGIVDLLQDKGQVILYGPPGTGKTYFARRLAWALLGIADDECYEDNPPYSLVQFHPAYSYEDFFEGFRPQVDDDGQMTYELTPGPLVRLAERAADHPDELHVMVIDEINRANLPRVLGELLYLLEYRDDWVQTQYRPDDGFELPSNLWIIGTMNTADRSIALIDAAMRRRFHFVPFFPDREPTAGLLRRWCAENEFELDWVADLLDAVNERLRADLEGDYMLIGPSHFMKHDLDENGLRRIWEYNIEPLIEDQFFGRQEVIDEYRFSRVWRRHGPGANPPDAKTGVPDGPAGDNDPQSVDGDSTAGDEDE